MNENDKIPSPLWAIAMLTGFSGYRRPGPDDYFIRLQDAGGFVVTDPTGKQLLYELEGGAF